MLTEVACKNASCPSDKARARFTDGGNLYLEVAPNGSKRWFWKYTFDGKEKRLAIGVYPTVKLKDARAARDEARKVHQSGADPTQRRRLDKALVRASAVTTYELVAREFHAIKLKEWSEAHSTKWLRLQESNLFPWIGNLPLREITARVLLEPLRRVESKGLNETAVSLRQYAGQVFRYGIATDRCEDDPATKLRDALGAVIVKNMAAVLKPEKAGALMRAIDSYHGLPATQEALLLSALLFQRPGNIRAMEWAWVDLKGALLTIGETIGEQVAKWRGYGDVIRDAEGRMRAQEAAARSLAEANAALAQKAQIAADKALGLGVEAQALVGTFEKARQAGDTVADSLGKVSKALDLSNVQGINAAGAALDALAERSKITSDQVREALSAALKMEDLGKFQTEATAAFDGSEIGARRLAAAIDALGDESLRRVGLSVQELKTGFGATTASAINDVDALAATFDRLGAKGPEVGIALTQALDKATAAAGTERALAAVIERYQELGKTGRLSGEQVAAGLEKAREKIDGLLPGVGSLREALHDFGLRSSEEMQATAGRFEESWKIIRDSVTTSLDDKIEAFEKYAAAAIAANKGVEISEISLQREMLRTRQIAAQGVSQPNGAPLRPQRASAPSPKGQPQGNQQGGRNADGSYQRNEDSLGIIGPNQEVRSNLGDTREERLAGQNAVDNRLMFQLRDKLTAGTLEAGDVGALKTVIQSLKQNAQVNADVMRWNPGAVTLEGTRDDRAWQATRAQFENAVARLEKPASSAAAPARTPTPAAGGSSHSLTIDLGGGRRGTFNMASESDASGLAGLLSQLSNARGVS